MHISKKRHVQLLHAWTKHCPQFEHVVIIRNGEEKLERRRKRRRRRVALRYMPITTSF